MKAQSLALGALMALSCPLTCVANGDKTNANSSTPGMAQQISSQLRYPDFARQLPGNREVIVHFHLNEENEVVVDQASTFDQRLQNYVRAQMECLNLVLDESNINKPLSVKLRFE